MPKMKLATKQRLQNKKNGGFQLPKLVGGRLDLSGMELSNLALIPVDPKLKSLVISNNNIRSFKTLKPQPNLEVIIARNNPIRYLSGLSQFSSLRAIDLSDTPLQKEKKFRERVIYTIGPQLNKINGEQVTDDEQFMADLYDQNNKTELKFLPKYEEDDEDQIDEDDPEVAESLSAMRNLYVRETASKVSPFAMNEAIVYDLKRFGMMPIITPTTTDDELIDAILNLKKRNALLTDYVDENMPDD